MTKTSIASSLPPSNTGTRLRRQCWTPAALAFAKALPAEMVTVKNMTAIEARLAVLLDIYNDH